MSKLSTQTHYPLNFHGVLTDPHKIAAIVTEPNASIAKDAEATCLSSCRVYYSLLRLGYAGPAVAAATAITN